MVTPVIGADGLNYVVAVEGLASLGGDLDEVAERISALASQAINATARRFRTVGSREIREQVNFPARYLDSRTDGKLRVRRSATPAFLEAAIEGRFDPTSLTRFVKGAVTHGRKSPTVEVAPGQATKMGRAFIMNLANGNKGLAIRLRPGETVENKKRMVSFSKKDSGLYLLYGPSVDQVFRSVADGLSPDAAQYLETEFLRLTEALL